MIKIYILDTSVLAYDPNAIFSFKNSKIILPIIILEELDKVKKLPNETGRNARLAIRKIDELSCKGDITKGIKLDGNIIFSIDVAIIKGIGSDPSYGDSKILACALKTKKANKNAKIIIVSRDINLRIRAKALGLSAEGYDKENTEVDELYSGMQTIIDPDGGLIIKESGSINIKNVDLQKVYQNEFVLFTDKGGKGIAPGRKVGDKIHLIEEKSVWGIKARSKEQLFAIDLLMDTNIPLVSIVGSSGGGKTLVALAAALELVLEKKKYNKLIIYRPITTIDEGMGWLPGTLEEKMAPFMQPILDSFELLFRGNNSDKWKTMLALYREKEKIEFNALSYIRGRSIPDSIILVDECQNLDPKQLKTILTRVGENTKIILTGDIFQIDSANLDPINNGLTYVIEKFKDSELAGHITFTKGERSALATEAANIL